MKVGVIGGGIMGLATAAFLNQSGVDVTVFEKERQLGGLSRSEEISTGIRWDRYYHVLLSTDDALMDFLGDVDKTLGIVFRETKTGFYSQGQLHAMSNVLEFIKFKPIGLVDKLRLALGLLFASRLEKGGSLERVYAKTWLVRVFGRRNYEKLWDPLMRSKFGSDRNKASALLIWATIKRYYGTRSGKSKKEMMGYIPGGYNRIVERIRKTIDAAGPNRILTDRPIRRIASLANKKIRLYCENDEVIDFDRVVATIPNPAIIRLWPDMPTDYREKLASVRYLGLVCVTLLLKRSLTPYYVTNLTDPGLPFTGVIEMTNVISKSDVGGHNLIYLPRYLPKEDSMFHLSDQEIFRLFFAALQKMFPFVQEEDVVTWRINREANVQPLLDIAYSKKVPAMQTPMENFFIANTTMITDSNLNNNRVVQLARKIAGRVGGDLKVGGQQ